MRIGIDVRCLADGKRSGVEEYTTAFLEALFEHDTENEYILFFNAWGNSHPDFSWATKFQNVTLKVFRYPNKLLNLSLWYLNRPKLDQLVGGTDIFFLPNLNFCSFSKNTKVVVTAHDLSFELFPETFSWKQRLWHYMINFRKLTREADAIIAVSESTRDDLVERYGATEEKIHVIPSGVGKAYRQMDRNDTELLRVQEKYKLPYKFILSLGTFEPRKNIMSLIQSFEALMDLKNPQFEKYSLVLAGTLGWKYDALYRAIRRSPYREKIILPGFIDEEDKTALYNLASVFVYPSFYEGFGFPPLEAMACGVPVITSHSSSLPEVVGTAGIVTDPYQPDELFQALRELLSDQDLYRTLQVEAVSRATLFSWKAASARATALFGTLGRH